ncbi:integrase catalytic domain-containing protein [Trichonephila clavipes]|nr:integrase catalytic domain-containing protein [Trichonephila clavipes]
MDNTKDYIAFKSKPDSIKSIIKELDILQNDYCALPDKVNLKNSMDTLSDLQEEAEETKLESIEDEPRNLNSQAKFCEEHFVNNHRRDESGQCIIQMTFLKEPSCLGESKQTAIRRLNSLWRKLDANPNLKQLYRGLIHEYLDMGHMEQLSDESEPTVSYYMPHQGVLRPDSKSTPLRTVFDASCSTSTGESWNSILVNGGVIQEDLFAILLRFRKNKIAFTSDIKKLFRMIFIDESQRDLLRIVWKESIDDSIKTYRMNRVVYDVSDSCAITKRSVLLATAWIFDPLGLISPVVTKAKLVMQELWRLKLDWNDSLPIHLETQWKRFVKSLAAINNLNIPRYILLDDALRIKLHGYCVSSLRAYGIAIYVKCLNNSGFISTNLLSSKSRIAPLKSVTIPRLELCAAVLLAKLIQKTIKSMKIPFNDIVLWTDSTIVLAWIKKDPSVLKPFVKNRVSVIQYLTEVSTWEHVKSQENPTDIIFRGINPDKIQDCVLWWYGPSVLQNNPVVSPCVISEINDNDLYLREFKKSDPVSLVTQNVELLPIINKYSSFVKQKRILVWCLRFKENARNP